MKVKLIYFNIAINIQCPKFIEEFLHENGISMSLKKFLKSLEKLVTVP